jgi:RNA polymerase-binding transcription factor DksA
MPEPGPNTVKRFKSVLENRRAALEKEITDQFLRSGDQTYQELAGRVHDSGEESIAEELIGLNLSLARSELNELRDVEAALARIADRSFGICGDCGQAIEAGRLEHNPAAQRCTECQARSEFRGEDRTPSL